MALRCKPDQLCLILPIDGDDTNAGKIVKTIALVPDDEVRAAMGVTTGTLDVGRIWRIDQPIIWHVWNYFSGTKLFQIPYCADEWLQPLPGDRATTEESEGTETPARVEVPA